MPEPQGNGGHWLDAFEVEDTIRGDKSLAPIKDVGNLAKAYVNLSHLQGGMVSVPDAKATDQDWEKFYAKLRPESPDKYEIKPGQLPEGLEYDKGMEKRFIDEVAFKNGLSNRQVQGVVDWWNNIVVALNGEARKEQEEAQGQLKQEWGRDFDSNTGLAKQIALKMGGQEYADRFDGLDNTTRKILMQVGRMTGNDKLVSGTGTIADTSVAQQELDRIRKDPKHPFNNKFHPEHKQARKDILELFRKGAK